jgi:hypothetical protein
MTFFFFFEPILLVKNGQKNRFFLRPYTFLSLSHDIQYELLTI